MLELHIWGPGFGLPSIDAECLAAIHYLCSTVPDESWCLIPSNNPNLNPYQRLPALRSDSIWVAGFEQICQYLSAHNGDTCDLDHDLNNTESAERDAYISFLYSAGIPLLDLSLYVSSENYTTCTRSLLGELLSWPQSWTIPHQLREQAKRRSEHLGLSALDVDSAQEQGANNVSFTDKIPKALRRSKQTVSELLGHGVQRTRFRLDAVTEDFLGPLEAKLGKKNWLIADNISTVDCLAIAIISLMQTPTLPQAWLKESLSNRFPNISKWAASHASETYGTAVAYSRIRDGNLADAALPWQAPASLSWQYATALAIEAVVSSMPIIKSGYECHEIAGRPSEKHDFNKPQQEVYAKLRAYQRLYSQAVFGCITATSLLGWMLHIGLLTIPRFWSAKPTRRNFGAAGAILGL